jgi:predicted XRE-type DNA-binding protein
MRKESVVIEIEKSSGNVYADMGVADADEMLVKAKLASKIGEILEARGWSQMEAAEVLGLPQPKLSNMLRGHFRGISEAKMMDCLTRLGRDVRIVIGKESRKATTGRVIVVSA